MEVVEMQFGRLYGAGLIILGIILCGLQFAHYMAPPAKEATPDQTEARPTTKSEHVTSFLPGIVGVGSFVAGIALFATARRRDEPDPKHAVK
jgi:hypothetical protein